MKVQARLYILVETMLRFLFVLFTLLQFCYADLDVIVMPFHKHNWTNCSSIWVMENFSSHFKGIKECWTRHLQFRTGWFRFGKGNNELFKENPKISDYFTNISVQFALLRGIKDSYYRGTRAMFGSLYCVEAPSNIQIQMLITSFTWNRIAYRSKHIGWMP